MDCFCADFLDGAVDLEPAPLPVVTPLPEGAVAEAVEVSPIVGCDSEDRGLPPPEGVGVGLASVFAFVLVLVVVFTGLPVAGVCARGGTVAVGSPLAGVPLADWPGVLGWVLPVGEPPEWPEAGAVGFGDPLPALPLVPRPLPSLPPSPVPVPSWGPRGGGAPSLSWRTDWIGLGRAPT